LNETSACDIIFNLLKRSIFGRSRSLFTIESFKADLISGRFLHDQDTVLENVVETYDSALRSVLDIHVPVLTKTITLRPNTEWYSDELRYFKIDEGNAHCLSQP
jgi:hypothetical protein